jgi:hypothetical protein
MAADLPIIQKTYDLIKWYVPILNQLPRDQRFQLGDSPVERLRQRMVVGLYDLLESLIFVRYQHEDKLLHLQRLNSKLDVLRYQTRLLLDFDLLSHKRYQYVGQMIHAIGTDLGGWIRQQQHKAEKEKAEARKSRREAVGIPPDS